MWYQMIPPPIPMTFREARSKFDVWEGTSVLEEDKNLLITALDLEVLCDENMDTWLFYWKRALLLNYPVYRDQVTMWAERKMKNWFFDNFKEIVTEHEGTFHLDEATKNEITENILRSMNDVFSGKMNGETNRKINLSEHSDSDGNTHNEYEDNTNAKGREFMFNYPEANYTGGVIPYDLDNDPNVEFLSTQHDSISRSNTQHDGSSEYSDNTDRTSDTTENTATENESNSTDDRNEEEKKGREDYGERAQDTVTHWIEKVNRQGDNINSLADSLIAQIPMTDFFRQFLDKILICFKREFSVWDI